MKENVIHPAHYNIPGRKECIEEMIDVFGYEKVENFCELNTYKYNYRHEQKNGQEDLEKSKNYETMHSDITRRDPRWFIAKHYGLDIQMQQLIEEMAELTQAMCRFARMNGHGQPVSYKATDSQILENLTEELADVKLCLDEVIYLLEAESEVKKVMDQKIKRCLGRIGIPGQP